MDYSLVPMRCLLVAVLVASASPAWATDADWIPETTKPADTGPVLTPHWLAVGLGANVRDTTYGALHIEYAQDRRWSVGALVTLGWRDDDVRRLQSGVVSEQANVRQWTLGLEGAWYALGDFDRGAKVGLLTMALEPRVKALAMASGYETLRRATANRGVEGVRHYSHIHGLMPRLGFFEGYEAKLPFDFDAALLAMDPDKDVDGLHPQNMGRLALGMPGPVPCTPAGIEALLAHYEIPVSGRHVVILGRGTTLGRPLALLLSQKRPTANAAVTVVHTGVPNWSDYTRAGEIVIAAAGFPGILQPEHITPGAVVVGGGVRYEGRRLLPDVDERCEEVAGAITPRLGGVGPTTIAMLFRNTVEAAERAVARR